MRPTIDLLFFELPLYSALVFLGIALGLLATYAYWRARARRAVTPALFLDGALVVVAAGWVGARAYHVALNWEYYAARLDEIAQPGLGGLGIRGAFIAGFIALAAYAWARRLAFGKLADAAAIGLALGQAIGWVGALMCGANYGAPNDSALAMELPDLYGLNAPRFPLQHFEIGLFALLFVGLLALAARRPRAGVLFCGYLLVASAANLALGFQRGDETVFVGVLRVDQIVDAGLGLSACAGLWWRIQPKTKRGTLVHAQ